MSVKSPMQSSTPDQSRKVGLCLLTPLLTRSLFIGTNLQMAASNFHIVLEADRDRFSLSSEFERIAVLCVRPQRSLHCPAQVCEQGRHQDHDHTSSKDQAYGK